MLDYNELRLLYLLAPSVLAFFNPPERAQELPRALYNHPGFWTAHGNLNCTGDTLWRRGLKQKLMNLSPVMRLVLADKLERGAWTSPNTQRLYLRKDGVGAAVPEGEPLRPVGRLPMALDVGCNPKIHPVLGARRRRVCPNCRRLTQRSGIGGISFEYGSGWYHEWCIISMWRHNPHVLKKIVSLLAEKKPHYWSKILDDLSKMGFLD